MINVPWAKEEQAAIVQLYFQTINSPWKEVSDKLQKLSIDFNVRAGLLGIDHDEKYRNLSGLSFFYRKIQYEETNGTEGLDSGSSWVAKMLSTYHQKPQEFQNIYDQYLRQIQMAIVGGNYMQCQFAIELSKLRKISLESVENTDKFDAFKGYLHIDRPMEKELKNILRPLKGSDQKCLILLCGSAGDGKSHLLSYLSHADHEHLLEGIDIYNDATESSAPKRTAIETLEIALKSFNDDNIGINDGQKIVLAINLGLLSNFIESDAGTRYSRLKEYVLHSNIFADHTEKSAVPLNGVFQHVSFSDYQVFSLTDKGAYSEYLEEVLKRIFAQDDRNIFYKKYLEYSTCTLCLKCPLRHNFEFLSDVRIQKRIIEKIIEATIKDKVIVSMRDILDFVYSILVHHEFDKQKLQAKAPQWMDFLRSYISCTTPMLLYEYEDVSPLMDLVKGHDILKIRSEKVDMAVTSFYSIDDITEEIFCAVADTPYQFIMSPEYDLASVNPAKVEFRNFIFKFIIRLNEMTQQTQHISDPLMKEYMHFLYMQNIGRVKELKALYDTVRRGIFSWNGQFGDELICIDDTNEKYYLLERLQLKAFPININEQAANEILCFTPILRVRFSKYSNDAEGVTIDIDYALFRLLRNMEEGYRPTVQDKNIHTDFVSAIDALIELGDKRERILLYPKGSERHTHIIFEKADFDYGFRVVSQS